MIQFSGRVCFVHTRVAGQLLLCASAVGGVRFQSVGGTDARLHVNTSWSAAATDERVFSLEGGLCTTDRVARRDRTSFSPDACVCSPDAASSSRVVVSSPELRSADS